MFGIFRNQKTEMVQNGIIASTHKKNSTHTINKQKKVFESTNEQKEIDNPSIGSYSKTLL